MPITSSGMYWDDHGPADGRPVLLLEGYTGQLIGWRQEFCDLLIAKGLRVLRMDNRDIGLSRHESDGTTYTITDMAQDVRDVIDDAGVTELTVVGQSMGGMIAQQVALLHPDVVRGLVLFYTTPTLRDVAEGILTGTVTIARTRQEAIDGFLAGSQDTASTIYPSDRVGLQQLAEEMYDRDRDQSGLPRQREAIRTMPDLTDCLKNIQVPVALIHGKDDALISYQGSLRLSQHLPNAELHLYPGLGHEIARPLWNDFAAIINHTSRRAHTLAPATTSSRPAPRHYADHHPDCSVASSRSPTH